MTADELERAIDDDPDDDDRRLVYADWLQQHGDPRGELGTVQHALDDDRTPALELRESELIAEVLGPLGPIAASCKHRDYATNGLDIEWRLGFLDSFRVTYWSGLDDVAGTERENWPELQALMPDEDDRFDTRNLLRLVARHPAARFLRRLRTGDTTDDYPPLYDISHAGGPTLLDTLVEVAIPTLRVLELGAMDCRGGETEVSWIGLGDVRKVLRAYPRLREVKLTGACAHHDGLVLDLGEIDLPELRWFELRTTDLGSAQLASILAAKWPIETLVLWFGSNDRGCEVLPEHLEPLLERPPPTLRHLALKNAQWIDDLIDPLAASPLLAQLESLDLSMGCLTNDGARELRDHEPAFRHLHRLVLDRSLLDEAGIAAVQGLCREVSADDQRERYEDDDRYVAVHE